MNIKSIITAAMALPVWWGTYPQVMFTFFKKHANDLKGKTVIPFTTHEGSGLANCVDDVKAAFPGANVQTRVVGSSYCLFLLAATQTGSSLIKGLLTAITPERLWGTYGSSR